MFGLWILVPKYFRQIGENVWFNFSHLKKICTYGEKNKDNANPDFKGLVVANNCEWSSLQVGAESFNTMYHCQHFHFYVAVVCFS